MNFLQASIYHLPNLRFLRKRRLAATIVFCAVYYAMLSYFVVDIVSTHVHFGGSHYPGDMFSIVFVLFILGGIGVLIQIRRLVLAFTTKRQALKAGTTMPQYEIAISPIEASVLIDAVDTDEIARLIINSLQQKGILRAWRGKNNKINLQMLDSGAATTYYEQIFITQLLRSSDTISLSDAQLRRHRSTKEAQREIYAHLAAQGYFAEMTHWQRFFYEYGITTTVVVSYISYSLLAIGMSLLLIGQLLYGPPSISSTQPEQIIFTTLWCGAMILTPLIQSLFGAYSKKGSEAFRNVYGLYWFLNAVYSRRLKNKAFVSKQEYEKYAAYAVAFGFDIKQ